MSFNTRITSGSTYNIVAKQPDCDVTNYDEWVASTGNRNYRVVDDYYATNPPAGAEMTGAGTDTQLFGLANLAAVTTIEAVQIWASGPVGGGKFLVWVDGEDSVERTAALTLSNTYTDALTSFQEALPTTSICRRDTSWVSLACEGTTFPRNGDTSVRLSWLPLRYR